MLSPLVWPNVITFSYFYCIETYCHENESAKRIRKSLRITVLRRVAREMSTEMMSTQRIEHFFIEDFVTKFCCRGGERDMKGKQFQN
jgi:hypothetical protein